MPNEIPTPAFELINLERLQANADAGGGLGSLSEQDKMELNAHRIMHDIVIPGQKSGKIDRNEHPWDVAVRLSMRGFRAAHGRDPEPNPAGPRGATTAEAQALAYQESVDRVSIQTPFGAVEADVKKDPAKRAPTRTALAATGRAAAGVASTLVEGKKRELGMVAEGAKQAFKGARVFALLPATPVLLSAHLMGLISKEEMFAGLRGVGGLSQEE